MCGINGFNFQNKELLNQMNNSLKHRGPDSEGIFSTKKISFGHRRLSIIDLSKNGSQPMNYSFDNKKVVIVFNGEIYNFQELKKSLLEKGYSFKSNTDTEVICASYLEWGENCVKKFNGMWAFAIYDLQNETIFLSRDRLGQKPLYYYFENGKFIFSSEIKGILKHEIFHELDKNSIDLYFSLGFIPAPYSIYKNIHKLEQKHNLLFDLKKKSLSIKAYYDFPNFSPSNNKLKIKRDLENLITDSVRLRMISDVPLGAFLSGGLDSSTIVKYMMNFNKNINTYSIGFDGNFDETPQINILKNHFKTNHHHKYFRKVDFEKMLKDIYYYYDEPFSDSSMFPTRMLSKFAKEKLTVSLSGDGGDEIFGGYQRYKFAYQMEILRKFPKFLRKFLSKLSTSKLKEGLLLSLLPKNKFYSEARKDYYKPQITKKILSEKLNSCLKKTGGNLIEAVRLMDIEFYTLPNNFLNKVDISSMINSLEVRCPFLDYRLLEYSMNLPTNYKISFFGEKNFFRKMISKFLPKKIINKKKCGFTPPLGDWISERQNIENLENCLETLVHAKIISKEWETFYKMKILNSDSVVSNNYKIRLFLFHGWCKYWKII